MTLIRQHFHCKNQKRQFAISYKTLWIVLTVIKILINTEKHEYPFLLKHPTDNISVGSSKLLIGILPRNYIKFVAEFDRREDILSICFVRTRLVCTIGAT